jgi:hypothetical protein
MIRRAVPVTAPARRPAVLMILSVIMAAMAAGLWIWHRHNAFDMVATLARVVRDEGTWDTLWDLQDRKVADLQQRLRLEHDPIQRLLLKREIAQQHINGGNAALAVDVLEQTIGEYRTLLGARDIATLKGDLAFAFFRLGEEQNCGTSPGADYCIYPIREGGVHSQRRGAEEAAGLYAELLGNPDVSADEKLMYRWMLTLAYMQLGKAPPDSQRHWLVPLDRFAASEAIGRFADVATKRGIVEFGRAGGAILEDFDNDGHLDLMVSHMGIADQMEYFHNKGDGTFSRDTEKAGLKGLLGGLNMVQADYDNDGCIDVFIPRGAWFHDKGQLPSSLLHNNCDGTFTDVSARAGVLNNYPSQAAVWADFNNDGLLDLFVGNEIVREQVSWPSDAPSFRLYINRGDGTFRDVGLQSGIKVDGMIKGVAVGDFMNDGRQSLYVTSMGKGNHLFRNVGVKAGVPQFVDVTATASVGEPQMSFTTWFFDYDNDGWPDIFVSGYSATMPNLVREMLGARDAKGARARLYRNNRDGTFTNVAPEVGLDRLLLTMGANFGDLDNDGWLDFYAGTGAAPLNNVIPNRMFHNEHGKTFTDVTTAGGFGHLQKGHSVAFGDIDNDGQQDVFANIGGAVTGDKFYSALFKNPGTANHWIKLDLVGTKANRFGVGARVHVSAVNPDGTVFDIYRTVGSGGSFGASSLRLHIGIGAATAVRSIDIEWPGSGTRQHMEGPYAADARYAAREDRATLFPVAATRAPVALRP